MANATISQPNLNEPENNENFDLFSSLYSWRNIMQRFKDLPFDETNSYKVQSEIKDWYHRVMQIQKLAAISVETDSSPTEVPLDDRSHENPFPLMGSHSPDSAEASNLGPYSRDFNEKYKIFIFKQKQDALEMCTGHYLDIKVHRKSVFLDSFNEINKIPENKLYLLRSDLHIELDDERWDVMEDDTERNFEYFALMSKFMFNPDHGLFKHAPNGDMLEINPESGFTNQNHLEYFKFVGRVVGMAVFNFTDQLPDCYFIRPFYKMMLGNPITFNDMEYVDAKCFQSLLWIKDNNPAGHGLTFSVDEKVCGTIVEKELIPGGRNKLVTEENKELYVEKMIEWRFSRIKAQMKHFMEGFNDIIPLDDIKAFDEGELEFVLSGIAHRYIYLDKYKFINVKAWQRNTSYIGYNPDDKVILWFWSLVEHYFNDETRARLLQFVTGTSKLPFNGLQEHYRSNGPQHFTIRRWGTPEDLPRANMSLMRMDLPLYETVLDLREKLIMAVDHSAGFEREVTFSKEMKKCIEGHILQSSTHETHFFCNRCRGIKPPPYSSNPERYRCKPCDYDLCENCHNSMEMNRCSEGHILKSSTRQTSWRCNGCGGDKSGPRHLRHRCKPCDYDLCEYCFKSYEMKKCNEGHTLQGSTKQSHWRCDGCARQKSPPNPNNSERYSCQSCDYDLCEDCLFE